MPTRRIHHIWDDDTRGDQLDADVIDRIDTAAGELVDAVRLSDPAAVERIVAGMSWRHLAALAVSVATLVEPTADELRPEMPWTIPDMKACHTAYTRGRRDDRTRRGELLYQQLRHRHHTSLGERITA